MAVKRTKKKAAPKRKKKAAPKRKKAAPKKKAAPRKKKAARCGAKTKEGKQCKRTAVGKSKYCSVHKKK